MATKKRGTIKIEKGLPLPAPRRPQGYITDTLRQLEIGDSFVLEVRGESRRIDQATLYGAAKRAGIRIATRKIDAVSSRIWRIA